jgi:CRP/FNR family transcriptional regulator
MTAQLMSLIHPEAHDLHIARCSASDVLGWTGQRALACRETDEIMFSMRRVAAGDILLHAGQPFEHLYCVGAGSFKSVQVDVEGYEQVLGFAIHGDMLGLDGLYESRHASDALALEDAAVAVLPHRELVALGRRVPALDQLLQRAAGAELIHLTELHYLMSASSAEVRVARFLMHFAQRQSSMGHSDRRLRLCMTRRDIASCLGVAHETVSRALTALAQDGIIKVSHREVEIVDTAALHDLQSTTRGRHGHHRDTLAA